VSSVAHVSPTDTENARVRVPSDDLASCERRIDLIAREKIDQMTQCRYRSAQDVRTEPVIDHYAVSFQIDFESRKRSAPILGMRCDRVTRPDKQGSVQAKRCDRIGNGKLYPILRSGKRGRFMESTFTKFTDNKL
jgi:hypothetical protein